MGLTVLAVRTIPSARRPWKILAVTTVVVLLACLLGLELLGL